MHGAKLEPGHAAVHVDRGLRNSNRTPFPHEAKARVMPHGNCWGEEEMVWQLSSSEPLPGRTHLVQEVNRLPPASCLKGVNTCLSSHARLLLLQTHCLRGPQDGRWGSPEVLPLVTLLCSGDSAARGCDVHSAQQKNPMVNY